MFALAQQAPLVDVVRLSAPGAVHQVLARAGPRAVASPMNADQQSLLFFAVTRDDSALEICKLLIDTYHIEATQEDKRGQTALHYLAKTGNVECVDLLVSRGCNIDHVDGLLRQTPLFYAARYSCARMVRRLVDFAADVVCRDKRGQTPLFWAESLEVCEELIKKCHAGCTICDSTGMPVAESHRLRSREDTARYIAACVEVRAQRGRQSWAVLRQTTLQAKDSGGAGAGASSANIAGIMPRCNGNDTVCVGYIVALARQRDVDQLCTLEDEFIEDHRALLPAGLSDEDVFTQIGLNQNPDMRRVTIRDIAQPVTRTGPVRHYTLKCLYLPPNTAWQSGTARTRTHEAVGYVYFKICDGDRDAQGEDGDALPPPAAGPGGSGSSGSRSGHIVVSHLKVGRRHQRRGVAILLLTGMLQFAEAERATFNCTDLYLSVIAKNNSAVGLYRSLGFVQTSSDGESVEWLHMRLVMAAPGSSGPETANLVPPVPTLAASQRLRATWLQRLSGACGSSAVEDAAAMARKRPSPVAGKAKARPKKRAGQKRAPSPNTSDVSAISTAADSVPSAASQASVSSQGSSYSNHFDAPASKVKKWDHSTGVPEVWITSVDNPHNSHVGHWDASGGWSLGHEKHGAPPGAAAREPPGEPHPTLGQEPSEIRRGTMLVPQLAK